MNFNRPDARNPRRRLVLQDEGHGSAPPAPHFAGTQQPGARSGRRNLVIRKGIVRLMDGHARITDLLPRRIATLIAVSAVGLVIIAGFEILYAYMPALSRHSSDGHIAAFDLDGEGSLSSWFSSFVLILVSGVCAAIYTIRKRTVDDYSATYRIWLWATVCWLVMSADEGGSLHEGFKELMTQCTGNRLSGDGSLWWVLAYAGMLGYVGLRLLWDMRPSTPSRVLLISAGAAFGFSVLVQTEVIWPQTGAKGVMLEEGCEMLGGLLLLLCFLVHARFLVLASSGGKRRRVRTGKSTGKTRSARQARASRTPTEDTGTANSGTSNSSTGTTPTPSAPKPALSGSGPLANRPTITASGAAPSGGTPSGNSTGSSNSAAGTGNNRPAGSTPGPLSGRIFRVDRPEADRESAADRLSKADRKALKKQQSRRND